MLFLVMVVLAVTAALALRLPRLAQRPMHADEANQACKAGDLLERGVYRYDPADHHGPTLYYLTLPALWLSGAHSLAETSEAACRAVPVIFGVALILALVLVLDGLGRIAAGIAAVLVAVCPAMVYYARYYIQETPLAFFTFLAIGALWRYFRNPSPLWAILAGAAFGLMHATKETWVLAAAAMVVAYALEGALSRWRNDAVPMVRAWLEPLPLLVAGAAACGVAAGFYSSFGRDWQAPVDSITAFVGYFQRGASGGDHAHPWHFYLDTLAAWRPVRGFYAVEAAILGLAVVGAAVGIVGKGIAETQRSFVRFLAFYTLALAVIYSAVSYKTPWCVLSVLHGALLLAGFGIWAVFRGIAAMRNKPLAWTLRAATAAACAVLVTLMVLQSRAAISRQYAADPGNPYAYAHTTPATLQLAERLQRLAELSPEGDATVIDVVTVESCWPLPWYLRRFEGKGVTYWTSPEGWKQEGAAQGAAILILDEQAAAILDTRVSPTYNRQSLYSLRPEVFVTLYVRGDLWEKFLATVR